MPTLRSMNHGGMSRCEIFCLIDRAHGRASSYVMSDIGAIDPGRWHTTHDLYMIGATSLVKVGESVVAPVCAEAAETARKRAVYTTVAFNNRLMPLVLATLHTTPVAVWN